MLNGCYSWAQVNGISSDHSPPKSKTVPVRKTPSIFWIWSFFYINWPYWSCVIYIKVNKSQMQSLVFSILPRNEQKMERKIILRAFRIVFFVLFLEELRIPKSAFEIYWPLVNKLSYAFEGLEKWRNVHTRFWICTTEYINLKQEPFFSCDIF